ncbi:excisionase family DNA-binding protein [Actinomadura sp. NEAU-AAG5]|uniref:Excisionase family DNA-binding protein n=2 Tax=Actinomadura litoris TaxID=2678616 RepID=A0A7K1L1C6_9ACTN|nr:excisionase family DNA-binding protein [Actinomadura litoris]
MPRQQSGDTGRGGGLSEEERQILLAELAEITAELDELHTRTRQITARVHGADAPIAARETAEYLNTSPRFPRRLVAERRIRFVKLGRFVRIPESSLREFVSAGLVEPMTASDVWRAV